MSYQSIPLKAGVPFRLDIPGALCLIDSPGVAGGVDLQLVRNGTAGPVMPNRKTAFRHVGAFDGVILTAAADTTVGLFLSFDDVQLGVSDGSAVSVPGGLKLTNTAAERVPVDVGGGVINVTAVNVGINNTTANPVPTTPYQAQAIANVAPAAAAAAASVFLAAAAARRGFRVRNVGGNAVAIGGAGLTFANAAVIIQPGETWTENEAPGAAWSCICDAGLASTLNIQTIT